MPVVGAGDPPAPPLPRSPVQIGALRKAEVTFKLRVNSWGRTQRSTLQHTYRDSAWKCSDGLLYIDRRVERM